MIGLYVHIPFCARRCPYCDFAIHVGADESFRRAYLDALRHELQSTLAEHARQWPHEPISTIYFGGGTPTSIGAHALNDLLKLISDYVPLAPDAEISLEGNPEDGNEQEYGTLLAGGWNRLSLGIQSLDDTVLKTLNRKHTARQVEMVVATAQRAGFQNLSLDLIFAVPGQSRVSWQQTLQSAMALEPQHLSCYSLTIEPETAFARRVERGRMVAVDGDTQADFMEDAERLLDEGGFGRYEISNWARPGYECRHNENYWSGGNYLACGSGSHGHRQGHRWWNERSAPRYVELIQTSGSARIGQEHLSSIERLEEMVMLGLRSRHGFDLQEISDQLHLDARGVLNGRLQKLLQNGLLETLDAPGDRVRLHPSRWVVADAVARQLLV